MVEVTQSQPREFGFQADRVLRPLRSSGTAFYIAVVLLGAVVGWGVYAYIHQLRDGLATTGMGRPAYWGVYMVNFVFFIGISHAGTLISAILRVASAEWRRPITRCAEVITVLALIFGGMSVVIDMGRPDRLLNVFKYGRLQSPILWDICCISTYLTGSLIYLYLPLVPDLAIVRDRNAGRPWLHRLYRVLSLGYNGSEKHHRWIERGISIMAIAIIPVAISVHTVVSYIFATTLQPGWHSTIFGPYFVVGAIFSGLGALLIAMAIIRKVYHLEGILKDIHFNNLGLILLVMTCLMIYFTFNIYLVEITGNEPEVMRPVMSKVSGPFRIAFWCMIGLGFILPALILMFRKGRSVAGCVCASILILAAMWTERYVIVVPTLMNPRLPWSHHLYHPTWVELSVTAACLAAFALLYIVFSKVFPIVSIWEVQEGIDQAVPEVEERFRGYMPAPVAGPPHADKRTA